MLLQDNFVHTDLHPGNILVRVHGEGVAAKVQLILLDFGLAEELTPEVWCGPLFFPSLFCSL